MPNGAEVEKRGLSPEEKIEKKLPFESLPELVEKLAQKEKEFSKEAIEAKKRGEWIFISSTPPTKIGGPEVVERLSKLEVGESIAMKEGVIRKTKQGYEVLNPSMLLAQRDATTARELGAMFESLSRDRTGYYRFLEGEVEGEKGKKVKRIDRVLERLHRFGL